MEATAFEGADAVERVRNDLRGSEDADPTNARGLAPEGVGEARHHRGRFDLRLLEVDVQLARGRARELLEEESQDLGVDIAFEAKPGSRRRHGTRLSLEAAL